jgi:hypothetical protein
VVGVGDFKDHRVNEGQIRANRNAVIEEARILQAAIPPIDIFFIEGPADALRRSALILAFHIGGVNGLARILDDGVALYFRGAGFRIDFDVADMCGEGNAGTIGHHFIVPGNGSAGIACRSGDFLDRQRREVSGVGAGRLGVAIFPDDGVFRNVPHLRGAFTENLDGVAGRANRCHASRECAAAAIGHVVVAEG